MLLTVTEVEYGEKEAANGKKFSGYYLRGMVFGNAVDQLEYFIADLSIKANKSLEVIKQLKADDDVRVDLEKGKVKSLYLLINNSKNLPTTNPTPVPSCVPFQNDYVSARERQESIERQNALTNATNLVCALNTADPENFARSFDKTEYKCLSEMVKYYAGKLLNFHKEIKDENKISN